MKNLKDFNSKIDFVLTDIDDTLTTEGQLHANAYASLWKLHAAGIKVIPITGRPAGWCEMIARQWPVAGIVGENGGFYFRYSQKKMQRWYCVEDQADQNIFALNRNKLDVIQSEILAAIPGTAVASDQFCRLMDLAIDFCEDVSPLAKPEVNKIVEIFKKHGAQAKVSSIHVNGWFGTYDKLTTTFQLLKDKFQLSESDALKKCIFVGDSPNDEPMFKTFPHSFGVANIQEFANELRHLPTYISTEKGGDGFTQIADRILAAHQGFSCMKKVSRLKKFGT